MGKLYPMLHVDQEVRSPAQEPRSGLFLKHLHRLVNGRRLIEKNWGSRIYLPPRADNYRSNRVCLLSWSLASSANPPDPKRFTLTPPGILGNSGNTSSSSGSLKFATRPPENRGSLSGQDPHLRVRYSSPRMRRWIHRVPDWQYLPRRPRPHLGTEPAAPPLQKGLP